MSTKRILGEGKYLRLLNENQWEYAERVISSGVVVIVATIEDRLILVEQFRASVAKNVIELPAGLVGDVSGSEAESLETAARRELIEETGFSAAKFTRLYEGPPSSGISNELVNLYLAEDLTRVGSGGGDSTENITVHEVPMKDLDRWASQKVREGALIDPKIFSGVYFALRDRLFERTT
jgi:ADP-ribose pyrophosphatase